MIRAKTICLTVLLLALLALTGCRNPAWDPVVFSCTSIGETDSDPVREVFFRFERGYLFIRNDEGGADNVCSQEGTVDCSVKMTRKALTLRQTVDVPRCGFRSQIRTTLDVERASGAFRLTQEACVPRDDLVITGICQSPQRD
ncbi:MAG: hypothetical protein AAF950_08610 [Pseudomonadota bacterium]